MKVSVSDVAADAVGYHCLDLGAGGLRQQPGHLVAYFPSLNEENLKVGLERRLQLVREVFGPDAVGAWRISHLPTEDWAESWKQSYRPIPVGKRLAIVPSWWEKPFRYGGAQPVFLDPGPAFGTGEHVSTRLALVLLEEALDRLREPARVADIGTGSGILAIAAVRLGAKAVWGFDVDEAAVAVARQNAAANHVAHRCHFALGDMLEPGAVQTGGQPVHLVTANVFSGPLIAAAANVRQAVAPGGWIVLAGITVQQRPRVEQAYREQGCRLAVAVHSEGWAGLLLRC